VKLHKVSPPKRLLFWLGRTTRILSRKKTSSLDQLKKPYAAFANLENL
jgi:hypothetical protein